MPSVQMVSLKVLIFFVYAIFMLTLVSWRFLVLGEASFCLITKEIEQGVTITFLGGAGLIIQVGFDSLLLCY